MIMTEVPTFLVAGHETTSTEVMWTLYLLSLPKHREYQQRLRQELLSINPLDSGTSEEPIMDVFEAPW